MPELPTHFGPYEVGSPLGAGGMGQVYRARDTRLQRTVAIKLLLDTAALDPDRRRRFAQEAIAASALNHPNILTVYDVGVEGDIPYLVSELIDGVSLRAEMNQGRQPLKRIIDIAHQIAEGLAAAHEAGIVHRDLKPENMMVTRDGRVKIVDFGLAADEEPALVGGPTATETAAGLIMGTLPYMSPEQARGDKADFRADQFALGVMLYEMTTATHPFRRDTAVQTLSAIITDDPPDPAQLNPALPVPLRWLIRRLLAKKPRERFAHTADLAADLRTIREYLAEATSPVSTPVVARRRRWQIPAAVAALLAGGFLLGGTTGSQDSGVRFDRYTPFATDAGYQGAPTWSPDGRQIAYEAEINGVVQIFTKTLGSAVRTQVTTAIFDSKNPSWSADGYIYYHRRAALKDALWRVSPIGGTPEMLIEDAKDSAVSPDGKTVFFLREGTEAGLGYTLWYSPLPAVHPQRYTRGAFGKLGGSSGYVRFSADGSRLLVWLGPDPGRRVNFWVIPRAGRDRLVDWHRGPGDPLLQGLAVDELHGEREHARSAVTRSLLEPIDLGDVGMIERRKQVRFVFELGPPSRVGRFEGIGKDFDRDVPAESRIAGLVNLAHATSANGAENLVRAQAAAHSEGHGKRRTPNAERRTPNAEHLTPHA